jgi:hypothetical protein
MQLSQERVDMLLSGAIEANDVRLTDERRAGLTELLDQRRMAPPSVSLSNFGTGPENRSGSRRSPTALRTEAWRWQPAAPRPTRLVPWQRCRRSH